MALRATLDEAGRLMLPKPVRDALHLEPGDTLELESTDDSIVLRPVRQEAALARENGVWVYRSGEPSQVSLAEMIREERERRDREIAGR